jgi:hypothetical protein
MASGSVKCRIGSCTQLVGPIRRKISDLCYRCDRNLEGWSDREYAERLEWKRRCNMFVERQEALPHSVSDSAVTKHIRTIVTASLREKTKKKGKK